MNRHGVLHSVNRPGCRPGYAEIELFFHALKGELIRKRVIKDGQDLRNIIKAFFVHFYNKKRLHASLNYCSPVEYEIVPIRHLNPPVLIKKAHFVVAIIFSL
jgi:putative transposase